MTKVKAQSSSHQRKGSVNYPTDRGPHPKPKNLEWADRREFSTLRDLQHLAFASFLKAVVPLFEKLNKILKSEKPLIHLLQPMLLGLLQEIQGCFIRPSHGAGSRVTSVSWLQKTESTKEKTGDLFVGSATSAGVKMLSSQAQDKFFSSVRKYYTAACDYVVGKFLLGLQEVSSPDALYRCTGKSSTYALGKSSTQAVGTSFSQADLLLHAQVADSMKADKHSWEDIKFFVDKFPSLLP